MEGEEMLRSVARDRLTPRLFFICDSNLCYPVDDTYAHFGVGQKLGIMDICAVEKEEFTNPRAADMVRDMALETEVGRPNVALRVSPASGSTMRGASSSTGVTTRIRRWTRGRTVRSMDRSERGVHLISTEWRWCRRGTFYSARKLPRGRRLGGGQSSSFRVRLVSGRQAIATRKAPGFPECAAESRA